MLEFFLSSPQKRFIGNSNTMYNIFLVSHTMSLLLPWFRCRSSQQRKPALVHSLLPAFLIGFAHSLGQDFCILLLPPCSFECPASSEQHACTYAAALESLDFRSLGSGLLAPLVQRLSRNILANVQPSQTGWTAWGLCWSFWAGVVSVSHRMPFSLLFTMTEFRTLNFASTMQLQMDLHFLSPVPLGW